MSSLILLNKPFHVLSQFTDAQKRDTLAKYIDVKRFPGFYPAGRLDYDSEGLLVLCSDGAVQQHISHPRHKLSKYYWAQVEGQPSVEALMALRAGPQLKDGPTSPCQADIIEPPELWPRIPPIRERNAIPTHWIQLAISEGRNRQVRRMTAAVGLPTLRLVRYRIGDWSLGDLAPGQYRLETVHMPTRRKKHAKRR